MAQYTTKRKYTKKPTGTKKVIKKVKKEVVQSVETTPVPTQVNTKKSVWQKLKNWFKV